MSIIYSDPISEKYRKYVIKVRTAHKSSYYLLWGTNLENEDEDYLMLDSNNNIIVFSKIKTLIFYVKQTNDLLDYFNTKKWAEEYRNNRAYTSYDLFSINSFLNEVNSVEEYEEENAKDLISFISLFSDYAYQLNNSRYLKLYKEDNLEIFRDYLNLRFFWKTAEDSYVSELNEKIRNLNFLKVKELVKEMIFTFESSLLLVSNDVY